MILIYTEKTTSRLTYTLKVIFNNILNIEFKVVDEAFFKQETKSPRINYSNKQFDDCIQIVPHTLLFEKDIINQIIEVDNYKGISYFFKTSQTGNFKHDIFASTFFMISRYEEYLPSELDIHGRFKAENSLAFQNQFLNKPIVNYWAKILKKEILKFNPNLIFRENKFDYINSIDVDVAYAYKGKNSFRLISSSIKAIITLNLKEIKQRYNYFIKKESDPLNTYAYIFKISSKYKAKNLFFFQIGNYGEYDKNLAYNSSAYIKLIRSIFSKSKIGIHPSYNSNKKIKFLEIEKERLEKIVSKPITKSRQHFLKLSFPTTYENLITNHIKEDYSLGFASQVGFRAGICTPYPFFNLETNQERLLTLYPFQIMDGTLKDYLKLTPENALEVINDIVKEIKKVDGLFISLWHNSSLTDLNHWEGWNEVYHKLITSSKTNTFV